MAIPDILPNLIAGEGDSPENGGCLLQVASFIYDGESWTDHPKCVHPLLIELGIWVNDETTDDARPLLARSLPYLLETVDLDVVPAAVALLRRAHKRGLDARVKVHTGGDSYMNVPLHRYIDVIRQMLDTQHQGTIEELTHALHDALRVLSARIVDGEPEPNCVLMDQNGNVVLARQPHDAGNWVVDEEAYVAEFDRFVREVKAQATDVDETRWRQAVGYCRSGV